MKKQEKSLLQEGRALKPWGRFCRVPNKVDQLFRAQLHHDRKQREERSRMTPEQRASQPPVDYLTPIVADGDTGHGGHIALMNLMKMFIERGAAGVHFEDQKAGTKKCGHMGGKVLVAVQEHCDRLIAARLQADIMGTETILVARTDAEAATLLDNNCDPRDHPFIVGATTPGTRPLREVLAEAAAAGADIAEVQQRWEDEAQLMRFTELIEREVLTRKPAMLQHWQHFCSDHKEHGGLIVGIGGLQEEASRILGAKNLPYFDWEAPRSREGYYRVKGGVDMCVARGIAFAPYCDLLWMETKKPIMRDAEEFSTGIKKVHPHQFLAYNLSPSFNWDAAGMTEAELADFNNALGRLGYVWQFITLAGFHANGLAASELAKAYAEQGVAAYVRMIQRRERELGLPLLTHQKWSGAEYIDRKMTTVTGGLGSTNAMGAGVTETQFGGPEQPMQMRSKL
uniref:isocitrate lyase n=1 Tax=Pinguiococcus pyrenoidosus TaxID=172671 RepID=A0A7R9U2Z1_9STRA|mmetsp:Transcript_12565/g.46435  ORF Transcript_12565/g.46435 Transcript_12565/m.46435 type:complete len:455 (+) Transcript_12565:442-1806(+)